jgi:hypothetical protein
MKRKQRNPSRYLRPIQKRIPLLHHEVMTLFHKFKAEHKDMVAEAMRD